MRRISTAFASAALVLFAGVGHAATISGTISEFCDNAPGFCDGTSTASITLTGFTPSTTDVVVTLTAEGDFDSSRESMFVDVDGTSLGLVFNGNPVDDVFDLPGDVVPSPFAPVSTSTTISLLDFNALSSDGEVVFSFTPSRNIINDFTDGEFISVSVEFSPIAEVPLPAAGWVLLGGLAGMGLIRRKARSKSKTKQPLAD